MFTGLHKYSQPRRQPIIAGCNLINAQIMSQNSAKSHLTWGRHYFFVGKLICKPDTNKQPMHKYALNFKTKGEQLYLHSKGGISLLIIATQGKIKESKSSPRVCSLCVFIPACLPPDVLSPPLPPSRHSPSRHSPCSIGSQLPGSPL